MLLSADKLLHFITVLPLKASSDRICESPYRTQFIRTYGGGIAYPSGLATDCTKYCYLSYQSLLAIGSGTNISHLNSRNSLKS